jgi:hypothetical protein
VATPINLFDSRRILLGTEENACIRSVQVEEKIPDYASAVEHGLTGSECSISAAFVAIRAEGAQINEPSAIEPGRRRNRY